MELGVVIIWGADKVDFLFRGRSEINLSVFIIKLIFVVFIYIEEEINVLKNLHLCYLLALLREVTVHT